MDESVHAGNDLGESAERHYAHDGDVSHVAFLELFVEDVPGVGRLGLVAERDAFSFAVDLLDGDFDFVADLEHVGGVAGHAPENFGNVDHTVGGAEVDEHAEIGDGTHGAFEFLADFYGRIEIVEALFALDAGGGADGADGSLARFVVFKDLDRYLFALERFEIGAFAAALSGGHEHPYAADVHNDAGVDDFFDGTREDTAFGGRLSHFFGVSCLVEALLGKEHGAFDVGEFGTDDIYGIAHVERTHIDIVICRDLIIRKNARMLGPQVDLDLRRGDGKDCPCNPFSSCEGLERLVQKFLKAEFFVSDVCHGFVYLLYYNAWRRRAGNYYDSVCLFDDAAVFLQVVRRLGCDGPGTRPAAYRKQLCSVGALRTAHDADQVGAGSQFIRGFLPRFRDIAYCIKNIRVCI